MMMRLAQKKSQKTFDTKKKITWKRDPKHREYGQTKHNGQDFGHDFMPSLGTEDSEMGRYVTPDRPWEKTGRYVTP